MQRGTDDDVGPFVPSFHTGEDLQFRGTPTRLSDGAARRGKRLARDSGASAPTQGRPRGAARSSASSSATPAQHLNAVGDLTVARTRNPDGDFTLDLEEIEQNLKRAQELTRHFAELEESCWGGRLDWCSDATRSAYKVPRLSPERSVLDLASETNEDGKENFIPAERPPAASPLSSARSKLLRSDPESFRTPHTVAAMSPKSALRTPNLISAGYAKDFEFESPVVTPDSQIIRPLDEFEASPAHDFPRSHPAEHNSEASSPTARSTGSLESTSIPASPIAGHQLSFASALEATMTENGFGDSSEVINAWRAPRSGPDGALGRDERSDESQARLTASAGKRRLVHLLEHDFPKPSARTARTALSWLLQVVVVLAVLTYAWQHPQTQGSSYALQPLPLGRLSVADWSPIGVLAYWRGGHLLAKPPGASMILPRTPEIVEALKKPKEAAPGLWAKLKTAGRKEAAVPEEVLAALEKPLRIAQARVKQIAQDIKKPIAAVERSAPVESLGRAVADAQTKPLRGPSPLLLASCLAATALVVAVGLFALARLRAAEPMLREEAELEVEVEPQEAFETPVAAVIHSPSPGAEEAISSDEASPDRQPAGSAQIAKTLSAARKSVTRSLRSGTNKLSSVAKAISGSQKGTDAAENGEEEVSSTPSRGVRRGRGKPALAAVDEGHASPAGPKRTTRRQRGSALKPSSS